MEILFFANGNTAVLRDGQQQVRLQRPWLVCFAEFLESQGHDPATCQLTLPNGQKARLFLTTGDDEPSWNWEVED